MRQSWYVIQTKPQREKDVTQLLKQGGFESFLPLIHERIYRKGTPSFRVAPLFPSYVFIHTNLEEKNHFHLIKYTRGVNKIICAENRPVPLPDEFVGTIRTHMNPEGIITPQKTLINGDKVIVIKGILKDLIGILQKPADHLGRVQVLLKLVNYQMKATLHWNEVERLKVA